MSDPSLLEIRDAAERVGVHYQTVYRWVRSGRLPSQLIDRRYFVRRDDLDALDRERHTPAPPSRPSAPRLDRQADRMLSLLLDGDERGAREIATTLVAQGASITDVITTVLVPPLRSIGEQWDRGDLSIWAEHRASAIVERILNDVTPNPRGRRRGTVVVAAVSGDHHSLPTQMAAAVLRAANWRVHHLGADVPPTELVAFCRQHAVDVVVVSRTNPEVADLAEQAEGLLAEIGVPTVLGGPGRSLDDLLAEVGQAAAGT